MKKHLKIRRYMPKNSQFTDNNDNNIMHMIFPSLIGISVCVICLVGLTFALFTENVEVSPQKITSANFALDTSVTVTDNSQKISQNEDLSFSLKAGISYSVTLNPTGKATGGYCIVRNGNSSYYTDTIKEGQSFSFTLIPHNDSDFTFVPTWGLFKGSVDITDSSVFYVPSTEEASKIDETVSDNSNTAETNLTLLNPADTIPIESSPVNSIEAVSNVKIPTEISKNN